MIKKLLLEDGTAFIGEAFGSLQDVYGEVVFTTAMSGYQELLTDPSFSGQILTMTYPLMGNYGINRDDYEAMGPYLSALIVREHCPEPSNFRMNRTLEAYLTKYGIPGLAGIDTRRLTRHIREKGAVKGAILPAEVSTEEGLLRIKNHPWRTDAIAQASTKNPYVMPASGKRVVLMDFGMKGSILKALNKAGYHVTVVPHDTDAQTILEYQPDGVLLSNGPGDPMDAVKPLETIRQLLGQVPLFGICMGHQLLALAGGARTRKMKFGHRGANQAVKDLRSGRVLITSQNHGYEVEEASLAGTGLEVTFRCVNDGSVEGLALPALQAFSVQFHPESAPGPHDAQRIFEEFAQLMENRRKQDA